MSAALDPVVVLVVRGALALLFLHAALHKLRDLPAFVKALADYEILPAAAAWPAACSVVAIELGLSIALALVTDPVPALAAAALLLAYGAAIAINLWRGRRDIDCGCAGPAGRTRLSPSLLIRNLVLAAASLVSALPEATRPLAWLDAFSVVAAIALATLVYAASETALANAQRSAILRGRA